MTALEAAELDRMTIHDLRHTAASLAVSSGANVKVVQRLLGHSSASMTLDVYADFDEDLDAVADSLDAARNAALHSETDGNNGRALEPPQCCLLSLHRLLRPQRCGRTDSQRTIQ